MEPLELIHEFTDGSLNGEGEGELFRLLADNEEYRGDFKQHLALKSAISMDRKAYTPAAASTLKIFSSLGFIPPAGTAGGIAGAGAAGVVSGTLGAAQLADKTGFFTKYRNSIITGLSSALGTAIIAYLLFQNLVGGYSAKNADLANEVNSLKAKNNLTNIQKPIDRSTITSNSNSNNSNYPGNNIHQAPIIKYIYVTKQPDSINDDAKNITKDEQNTQLAFANNGFLNERASFINGSYPSVSLNKSSGGFINISDNVENTFDMSSLFDLERKYGVTYEFRNTANWFDTPSTISPKNYNKLNNTSLTILYQIINWLSVGGELRQETFFQRFNGIGTDSLPYLYDQQPNFTSLGLVVRLGSEEYNLYGIYPFAQYSIDMNTAQVGLINRGMAGLLYSPYNGLTFILGAEFSNLTFSHQGTSYISKKYGLNYGISFGF